jgi:serine/threonine-protein kinase
MPLVIDFQVPLWFSVWTSPQEYLAVEDLRKTGRFPASGVHRLGLTPGQRFQALTRANPALSLLGVSLPLIGLLSLWWVRRRRHRWAESEVITGYTMGERLGAGAMGEVFSARAKDGLDVAVKFLRPEVSRRPDAAQRFDREIAQSMTLSHPNLLAVYGYGFSRDGRLYLATERLRGKTLKQVLKDGVESPPELALEVVEQIGSALHYLHQSGVMHRDVKPENIFQRQEREGKGGLVLMDLGIAQTTRSHSLTVAGRAMGTPAYMSPEQVRGKPEPASDQYALGLVLYEILVGQRPFRGLDAASLAHQQIHDIPEPPSKLEPRICVRTESAILRMLAKEPDQRFPSLEEARQALAESLHGQHWSRQPTS